MIQELSIRKVSLGQTYSFPQGKLHWISLVWPDKDKYDSRDKKQHNFQKFNQTPGPNVII